MQINTENLSRHAVSVRVTLEQLKYLVSPSILLTNSNSDMATMEYAVCTLMLQYLYLGLK